MTTKENPQLPKQKPLHPRNIHHTSYDFANLITICPELEKYVKVNEFGNSTIDFANPKAVKWLNKALLKKHYNIDYWDIPKDYLCPPIPGRADYIHHIADLLARSNNGNIPSGNKIKCLDVGVGASCIYPIIGNKEYGWSFIGSEIDDNAIESLIKILNYNPNLRRNVEIRHQENLNDIFHGIVERDEYVDLTICNPPFHNSMEEAVEGTLRKLSSLNKKKITVPKLNFGGQNTELWCVGGEERFVRNMIRQSKQFASNFFWFSTLISKKEHLASVYEALKTVGAKQVETIQMEQGTKVSRFVAWTFLNADQQKKWIEKRWNF